MKKDYRDILYLNRPHSFHKKMSQLDRAAQFAPFAALNGHYEAILETQRLTEDEIYLSEEMITILNKQIQMLKNFSSQKPYIVVTYFIKDTKKKGGYYQKKAGVFKHVNEIQKSLVFIDKEEISIPNIIAIECDLFPQW